MLYISDKNDFSPPGQARSSIARDGRIDVMRGFACLLLVVYHVIGNSPSSGLSVDYPHPLRLFADALSDVRLPMFAFLSGFVYQYRPVKLGSYPGFLKGKAQRLLVPGIIAIFLFELLSHVIGTQFAMPWDKLWEPLFFPYAHFWYLQAIFAILAVYGVIDALLDNRYATPLFFAASALYTLHVVPGGAFFSVNGVVYLLPYFLFGVMFHRNIGAITNLGTWLTRACIVVAATSATYKTSLYLTESTHNADRFNFQSLVLGLSLCILAFFHCRRSPILEKIGQYSFFIYLYHPLGLSAMRRALYALGLKSPYAHLLPGLMAGIGVPVLMFNLAERHAPTRRFLLGLRDYAQTTRRAPAADGVRRSGAAQRLDLAET
jgi:fucose 4-O-acetylase-like acetyltransferase